MGVELTENQIKNQKWRPKRRFRRKRRSFDWDLKSLTARTCSVSVTCTHLITIPSFTSPIYLAKKPSPECPVARRSKPIEMRTLHTPLCRPLRMSPSDARSSALLLSTSKSAPGVAPSRRPLVQVARPPFELSPVPARRLVELKTAPQFHPILPEGRVVDVVDDCKQVHNSPGNASTLLSDSIDAVLSVERLYLASP